MAPRKPKEAAPPPVVYVSPESQDLLDRNAALSRQVEDLRAQVAGIPALRTALEEASKEAAILRSRIERDAPRAERERLEDQVRTLTGERNAALSRAEKAETERDTWALAYQGMEQERDELRARMDELTAFPCPDEPTAPAEPCPVHLVSTPDPTTAGPVPPCTRAEDAPAAYTRAREALSSRDPGALRAALDGLPTWTSKKTTALRQQLTAALAVAA